MANLSSSTGTSSVSEPPLRLRLRLPAPPPLDRNTQASSSLDTHDDPHKKIKDFVTDFFEKYHFTLIGLHNIDPRFLENLYAVCASPPEGLQAMVVNHMLFSHERSQAEVQRLSLLVEMLILSFNKLSSHTDQLRHTGRLRQEQGNDTIALLRNEVFILEHQLSIANRQLHRRATSEALSLLASSDEENVPRSPVKKPRVDSGDGTLQSPHLVSPQILAI